MLAVLAISGVILGVRYVKQMVGLMRGPAASTARQFVAVLGEGDLSKATPLLDPAFPAAELDAWVESNRKVLRRTGWTVTFATESKAPDGRPMVTVYLSRGKAPLRDALRVYMVLGDGWRVITVERVDPESQKIEVKF